MMDVSSTLKKKKVGYIENSQLRNSSGMLLPRIGTRCSTCKENNGFTLVSERYTKNPTQHDTYYLQCDNCVEQIGLDYTELVKIEKIAKLNEKLELGKISKEKYDKKIGKYLGR